MSDRIGSMSHVCSLPNPDGKTAGERFTSVTEATTVYTVRYRTAMATYRDPVSKIKYILKKIKWH